MGWISDSEGQLWPLDWELSTPGLWRRTINRYKPGKFTNNMAIKLKAKKVTIAEEKDFF